MSSFDYVNTHYGKNLKRGSIVTVPKGDGRVYGVATKATHHVYVRVEGEKHANPYHPDDVQPAEVPASKP